MKDGAPALAQGGAAHAQPAPRELVMLALVLSLGAAVSLGITRFSYGLLLPLMRADLGWSYTLAGAMNTANAVGYLLGALATPALLQRRQGATRLLVGGSAAASVCMAAGGSFTGDAPLLLLRLLAGVASATVFVAGGLLAARLGAGEPRRAGLLLGMYYGGTGIGIALSAVLVPATLALAQGRMHPWAVSWWALAAVCAVATLALLFPARRLADAPAPVPAPAATATSGAPAAAGGAFRSGDFAFALAGYGCFGAGYIGYMTFVVALLRERGMSPGEVTVFYTLLGLAVVGSSRIWAGLLDRHRGGGAMARLTALLGIAAILPALTGWAPAVMLSGLLFGAVFLSVVAATTALVRHNVAPSQWARGIAAFTVVFALGQIVGPTLVGRIADGPGGLARGLWLSALVLWLGATVASRQRPLAPAETAASVR